MSLARASLVIVQALANHWACTPPNITQQKSRYHTEELYILQIAPLIFKIHMAIIWICAFFEILYYASTMVPASSISPLAAAVVCPRTSVPHIYTSPIFTIGITAVALGSYIRLDCFKALGHLFTFDLTIHPEHRLITSRFYSWVRHPAYTGSMLLIAGLSFSHLTAGSWLTECGPLRAPSSAIIVCAAWWMWTLAVGVSRAEAEDKQMQKLFPEEWDKYAVNVPWWFFPGLA
jgi:protein-S-isoprenylcysteine O-methyltransferase Ste14